MKKEKNIEGQNTETVAEDVREAVEGIEKKTVKETPKETKTVKARFKNHYIGRLGNFSAGKVYDLSKDTYELFKDECEVVG